MAPPANFSDMMDASPAALAKMRAMRSSEDTGKHHSPAPATPHTPSTPSYHAHGNGNADLGKAFDAMTMASPANLAKMRDSSSPYPTTASFTPPIAHHTPVSSGPKPPTPTFQEMCAASPADLAKLRAAHDHAATHASPSAYPASPAVYRSPNPAAFASMFGASPADLAKMRQGLASSSSTPGGAAADPSRFDDMYGASPAQLTKMRSVAGAHDASTSSSYGAYTSAHAPLSASSDRFAVVYDVIASDEKDARDKILAICLEQTVELPASLVPEGSWIREHVVGKLESLTKGEGLGGSWRCEISYHADTAGGEMTQLVNVIFGNTSMKEGVMVADVRMPPGVLRDYPGPKFGVEGLRKLAGVPDGAVMLMTALKPMGSSTAELARMAYEFAKGGIDIIKDDHGLADQPYSRYDERIRACAKAVDRANQETGRRCVYAPCVCAPAHLVISRAHAARDAGAGAVLMIPGITGMDTMRELAADATFGLPIICHPAMLGAMLGGGSKSRVGGFSHEVLLGVLPRLAGADMTIFPSFGGRFGFSVDECRGILRGSRRAMGTFPSIFPTPGGGMTMERVAKMKEVFGDDICLLIGGSLMGHSPDLVANSKFFMDIAGRKDLWGPKEQISGH